MERKLPGKFFENLGIPREAVLFFGNVGKSSLPVSQPKNAVPFATGSCRKFKPEVLVEWKAPFVNRPFYSCVFGDLALDWKRG